MRGGTEQLSGKAFKYVATPLLERLIIPSEDRGCLRKRKDNHIQSDLWEKDLLHGVDISLRRLKPWP